MSDLISDPPKPESWTFLLGVHSGIPECCARFYERLANPSALNARRGLFPDGVEYVMCTRCLRRYRRGVLKPAAIHRCLPSSPDPICRFYRNAPDLSVRDAKTISRARRALEVSLGRKIAWT